MKFLIPFFTTLIVFFTNDLDWARKHFQTAQNNKTEAVTFYDKTNETSATNPTLLGYKAAGKMLRSKYEKNKQLKKELFKQGALDLNGLIEVNPKDIELRFIRLAIQQNVPAILKYNANIKEDKQFILSNFKDADHKLQVLIKDYILASTKFTDSEKNSLQ